MTDAEEIVLIARVNALPTDAARDAFFRCCGVESWAEGMASACPFADLAALDIEADTLWRDLTDADWRTAFSHHPKIGDIDSLRAKFASTAAWAHGEQSGATGASDATLHALAAGNDAYLARFGYIFIVCATGKTADEMLTLLQARLPNAPEQEIAVAAEEQRKITRLRLRKL